MARCGQGLRIHRREAPVRVLGPGRRAVIWLQGCPRRCSGCITPHAWDASGGTATHVEELARWILAFDGIEGVTFSGGEPMIQAEGLTVLVERLREERDLGVVCYTGYTIEHLRTGGTPAQKRLLSHIDLLIDGPYQEPLHADLLWRASSNQRLLPLTSRYAPIVKGLRSESDRSCGMEFRLTADAVPSFIGVPPRPGFADQFQHHLNRRGVHLQTPPRPDPHSEANV